MRLINRLLAWISDTEQLGCPDREIHDRNNENSDVMVTALKFESVWR